MADLISKCLAEKAGANLAALSMMSTSRAASDGQIVVNETEVLRVWIRANDRYNYHFTDDTIAAVAAKEDLAIKGREEEIRVQAASKQSRKGPLKRSLALAAQQKDNGSSTKMSIVTNAVDR